MTKTKIKTRKLSESSWLAQIIKDNLEAESNIMGLYATPKYNALATLLAIVNEADNKDNGNIYYYDEENRKCICICEIPDLSDKKGTAYNTNGMQNKLRGIQERYKDDDNNYILSVMTTLGLNSATIKNLDELMFQILQ